MTRALRALLLLGVLAGAAFAHEVRPSYLEIRQRSADTFDLLWKVPARGEMRLGLHVELPADCTDLSSPQRALVGDAFIDRWSVRRAGGLNGTTIRIAGLSSTTTDVLVRMERLDSTTQVVRLTPARPFFLVEAAPRGLEIARTYLLLGVEHILLGLDHLLFVLALLILVRGWRRVVGTITAFTLAHSITLAAATLGFVRVPGPPVEAIIALSIAFVACEIIHRRQGRAGLTERQPWLVAFSFGLLHGLGFAGALHEVGLPNHAIPLALLLFNLGVELGQLLFIGVVLAALGLAVGIARRMSARGERALRLGLLEPLAAYCIGGLACYWLVDRTVAFIG